MAVRAGYSPISSTARVRILELLADGSDRALDELVEATDLHANTVREHLQRLISGGYVVAVSASPTGARGRPRSLYRLAMGTSDSASPIAVQKAHEAAERGDLMRRTLPETIAEGFSTEELHQLDAIIEHLEETGFDPQIDTEELTVDLSPCTHLDGSPEAEARCSVHLNMMQSVLSAAGNNLAVEGMAHTCNPNDCVIQLRRRDALGGQQLANPGS